MGQRGILVKAQEAGRNYQEAERREDEQLENYLKEVDDIANGLIHPEEENTDPNWTKPYDQTKKDNYEDNSGKKATIPKGFQVSKKEGETKIDEGLVVRDATTNNEFVWIPCTEDGTDGSIKYERYAFSKEGWEYTQTKDEATETITMTLYGITYSFTEPIEEVELSSIKKYGGFYIGRYEVGIENGTKDLLDMVDDFTAPSKEWTGWKNGTPVVQANKQVWNYITRNEANKVAQRMYQDSNSVTSRLCSSCARDTAIQFIGGEYGINSTEDNYSGTPNKTGEKSVAVKNIYDMGGNVSEWSMEACTGATYPWVTRGGYYSNSANIVPAGVRSFTVENGADAVIGFRIALYVDL